MPIDKSEIRLDKMLSRALQSSCVPVPPDFTDKMLTRVREAEEQRLLTRVVMQEKLALAGCIALGISIIAAAAVVPEFAKNLTGQAQTFLAKISQTAESVRCQWQFYTILAGALLLAVYNFMELLSGDS